MNFKGGIMSIFKYVLDIPKTLYFNFKVLNFRDAVKLPFYVSHNYKIILPKHCRGIIEFKFPKSRFCVRFVNGGSSDIIPNKYGIIQFEENTKVIFNGSAKFSAGCCIKVVNDGKLIFGKNFSANRNCSITSTKKVTIGDDCILAFNIIIRDTDGHDIIKDGSIINPSKAVRIGDRVWICGNCALLKGTSVMSNSIIGFGTILNKEIYSPNVIIAGIPGRIVVENVDWKF